MRLTTPDVSSRALISPLAIAPMIDWTYTHFRMFMRILAPRALLYTEMQTPGAIVHNPTRAIDFHPDETPLALQLGGADAKALVACARIAEDRGYAEINLNLGCPSDRVQAGRFGACLMLEPQHVAHCIDALKNAVRLPVSAKTRLGVDDHDDYAFFANFISHLVDASCDKLIIHARKAWLHGLSPKQNRTIPPIQYDYVYQIKQERPHMPMVINGQIKSVDEMLAHLKHVDGVMVGRMACDNPYGIAKMHHALYPHVPLKSRQAYLLEYIDYIEALNNPQIPRSLLLKPIFGMAYECPGARLWKKALMSLPTQAWITPLRHAVLEFL